MGIGKNTTFMVLGSLALLVTLGFADPDNTRLMPSFFSSDPLPGVVPKGAVDEAGVQRAIAEFNRLLSAAYLAQDAAALTAVAMDDGLRQHYVEEIAFLQRDGRVLEQTVRDIRVKQMTRLVNQMLSVDTNESVGIRYLSATDTTPIVATLQTRFNMNYTLEKSAAGWKVMGIETMEAAQ